MSADDRLWTIADLAARWGVSVDTAWDRVKAGGIRGVWLGSGEYRPTKAGAKLVRFREAAVIAFESDREITLNDGRPRLAVAAPTPAAAIPGWDGKVRGKRSKT